MSEQVKIKVANLIDSSLCMSMNDYDLKMVAPKFYVYK